MAKNLLQNPIVVEYLMESNFYEVIDGIIEQHGLDDERRGELYDVTDAVIEGRLPVTELPAMVGKAFGLDEVAAQKLATDLAGHRLLPLELFLPGIAEQITAWGGKMEDYPAERLTKTELSAEDITKRLVDSLLEVHQVELPEAMRNRLAFLLKGYLSGERNAEATKKMLMRGENIGGLSLPEEVTANVLQQVDELRGKVDVVDEAHEETSAEARKVLGEDIEVEKGVIEGTYVTADGRKEVGGVDQKIGDQSEEDIEKIKDRSAEEEETKDQRVESKEQTEEKLEDQSADVENVRTDISQAANLAAQKPASKPAKPSSLPAKAVTHALAKEVPVISGSVLKEDEEKEIANHKEQAKPAQKTALDRQYEVAAEEAYGQVGSLIRSKRIKKADFLKLAMAHIRGLKDPLRTEEQLKTVHGLDEGQVDQILAALEASRKQIQMAGEKAAPVASSASTPEISEKEKRVLDQRHAALTQKVASTTVEPILPNARVSAARSKEEEIALQAGKVNQEAVKKAEAASKPKKARVKVSQSTAPQTDGRMVDVQYQKKLIGPVEQLGTMGTEEFRRLSSDAQQAMKKILDQLSVLKEEHYEQYIEGVKAWRRSPMNQLYIAMTQEALTQGMTLTEVASQRRNRGEESLSPAEVQALMQLNQQVAF